LFETMWDAKKLYVTHLNCETNVASTAAFENSGIRPELASVHSYGQQFRPFFVSLSFEASAWISHAKMIESSNLGDIAVLGIVCLLGVTEIMHIVYAMCLLCIDFASTSVLAIRHIRGNRKRLGTKEDSEEETDQFLLITHHNHQHSMDKF